MSVFGNLARSFFPQKVLFPLLNSECWWSFNTFAPSRNGYCPDGRTQHVRCCSLFTWAGKSGMFLLLKQRFRFLSSREGDRERVQTTDAWTFLQLLQKSGVFRGTEEEITIWLQEVLKSKEEDRPFVLMFLQDALFAVLKRDPDGYVDQVFTFRCFCSSVKRTTWETTFNVVCLVVSRRLSVCNTGPWNCVWKKAARVSWRVNKKFRTNLTVRFFSPCNFVCFFLSPQCGLELDIFLPFGWQKWRKWTTKNGQRRKIPVLKKRKTKWCPTRKCEIASPANEAKIHKIFWTDHIRVVQPKSLPFWRRIHARPGMCVSDWVWVLWYRRQFKGWHTWKRWKPMRSRKLKRWKTTCTAFCFTSGGSRKTAWSSAWWCTATLKLCSQKSCTDWRESGCRTTCTRWGLWRPDKIMMRKDHERICPKKGPFPRIFRVVETQTVFHRDLFGKSANCRVKVHFQTRCFCCSTQGLRKCNKVSVDNVMKSKLRAAEMLQFIFQGDTDLLADNEVMQELASAIDSLQETGDRLEVVRQILQFVRFRTSNNENVRTNFRCIFLEYEIAGMCGELYASLSISPLRHTPFGHFFVRSGTGWRCGRIPGSPGTSAAKTTRKFNCWNWTCQRWHDEQGFRHSDAFSTQWVGNTATLLSSLAGVWRFHEIFHVQCRNGVEGKVNESRKAFVWNDFDDSCEHRFACSTREWHQWVSANLQRQNNWLLEVRRKKQRLVVFDQRSVKILQQSRSFHVPPVSPEPAPRSPYGWGQVDSKWKSDRDTVSPTVGGGRISVCHYLFRGHRSECCQAVCRVQQHRYLFVFVRPFEFRVSDGKIGLWITSSLQYSSSCSWTWWAKAGCGAWRRRSHCWRTAWPNQQTCRPG